MSIIITSTRARY